MEEAGYLFEVEDWRGRRVRMTRRTLLKHQDHHPEVLECIEEAQQTIEDPDLVLEADNGSLRLCRLGLGRDVFSRAWLVTVVYYRRNIGTVATYFFMRRLPDERIVERRAIHIAGSRISTAGGTHD